jgi:hypothetical protein
MFVNAWLQQSYHAWPGTYPSGGPVPQVHDVWRAAAPSIDILAPDAHLPKFFDEVITRFTRNGNPLFIPETEALPANAILAVGKYNAIGFSPTGIGCGLNPDLSRCVRVGPTQDLADTYNVLSQLAPMILAHQGTDTMTAVRLQRGDPPVKVRLGNYTLTLSYTGRTIMLPPRPRLPSPPAQPEANGEAAWSVREWNPNPLPGDPSPPPGARPIVQSQDEAPMVAGAVLIATGPDEYYIGGGGVRVDFTPNTPGPANVGLGDVEEGKFVDGKWKVNRVITGDDTAEGEILVVHPNTIFRVTLYRFP